jgi:hypothetical protein
MTNAVNIAQSGSNNVTMRNRIINGAMMIDQRNNGAAVTFPSGGLISYTLDRWNGFKQILTGGSFTVARSTVAPAGFTNSALVTITSAVTDGGSSVNALAQFIEGLNVADLGWGTANAQPVTLSFWVRSSVTGTYSCSVNNDGYNYSYVANYTILAANTWEQKTITIPGPTAGTWLTTNGAGLRLWFDLGTGPGVNGTANTWTASGIYRTAGSVQLLATNGATWQITGVQLEEGTAASPFENRLFGQELALCQRYYEVCSGGWYGSTSGTSQRVDGSFIVSKRAAPTLTRLTSSENFVTAVNVGAGNDSSINWRISGTVAATGNDKFMYATLSAAAEL